MKGFIYLALHSLTLLALVFITSGQDTLCENTCKDGSTCVPLYDKAICLCANSFYYKNEICNKGDVFSGKLIINSPYVPDLENKTSLAYQNLHDNITKFFSGAFGEDTYGQTIIVKVSPSISARHGKREADEFGVTIRNIFNTASKLTEEKVTQTIQDKIVDAKASMLYSTQTRPCDFQLCSKDASCVNLYNTSFCQCPDKTYPRNGECHEGDVFSGKLIINSPYVPDLENKTSLAYQNLHENITKFFSGAFGEDTYGQTIIVKVSPSISARHGKREADEFGVTIRNIFNTASKLTEEKVTQTIQDKIVDAKASMLYSTQTRPCDFQLCSKDASCVNLYNTSFCQCPDKTYPRNGECHEGDVFSGKLIINSPYVPDLENKTSLAYQNLHENITKFFSGAFGEDTYGQTIIVKVSPSISARHGKREADEFGVTIRNIFNTASKLTEEKVTQTIQDKIVDAKASMLYSNQTRPCDFQLCSKDASCVNLYNTSFCQCPDKTYPRNGECHEGDVFSGKLIINSPYVPDLENKTSLAYQNLHDNITKFFSGAFGEDTYGQTIIVKVSPSISARHGKREADEFGVTIRNIFNTASKLTEEKVTQTIQDKIVDAKASMLYSNQTRPCDFQLCSKDASCVNLYNTSFCQCPDKTYPRNGECHEGDVFSGKLIINSPYVPDLENKTSLAYQNLHDNITKFFSGAFGEDTYGQTIIVKVSPSISARHGKREADEFGVTIRNIFNTASKLTEEKVTQTIQDKIVDAKASMLYSTQTRPCDFQLCSKDASCVNLYNTSFCQCPDKTYPRNGECHEGDVFSGKLIINSPYVPDLENKTSLAYQNLHENITKFFSGAFGEDTYGQTIIVKVSPSISARHGKREADEFGVTIRNIFNTASKLTEEKVTQTIQDKIVDAKASMLYSNQTRPCDFQLCSKDASCVNLYNTSFCQCPDKTYPRNGECHEGDVFSGKLIINSPYVPDLENKTSLAYQNLHENITKFFSGAFGEDTYGQTIIVKVSPSISARHGKREADEFGVTIRNIFNTASKLTEEKVTQTIQDKIVDAKASMLYSNQTRPCDFQLCSKDASCVNLYNTSFCQCPDKTYPRNGECHEGDVFSGKLIINSPYVPDLENKTSLAYQNLHDNITKFFSGAFGEDTYGQTIIVKVSPSISARHGKREADEFGVTIRNIFNTASKLTEEKVTQTIQDKIVDAKASMLYSNQTRPCDFQLCSKDASCVNLYNTSFCQCPDKTYPRNGECHEGDVFSGKLIINSPYVPDLENKTSLAYQNLHDNITKFFSGAFGEDTYGQTIIVKVSPSISARHGKREADGFGVTITNILNNASKLTEEEVTEIIEKKIVDASASILYSNQTRPCDFQLCSKDASCVNLYNISFCQCPDKKYHRNGKCNEGRAFPGTLTLNKSYESELENKESLQYQELYSSITNFFAGIFKEPDYGQTIIQKVSPYNSSRYGTRAAEYIDVTLVNMFITDTKLTEENVYQIISTAVQNSADFSTYTNNIGPCAHNNCTAGSKCDNLNNTFICLCEEGKFYREDKCNEGTAFTGTLTLNRSYEIELEDKESLQYQELHSTVTNFFAGIFKEPDYGQTIIQKVSPYNSSRYGTRAAENIDVTLMNMFNTDTKLTEEKVNTIILEAVKNSSDFSTYTNTTGPCAHNNCTAGSECVNLNSMFICLCEEGKFYKEDKCNEGTAFTGTLTLNRSYEIELEDKESLQYQELHSNVTKLFEGIFKEPDYGQTIIQKVSPYKSSRYGIRTTKNVDVVLVNMFSTDTKLTEEDVYKNIKEAIENSTEYLSYMNRIRPCVYNNCSAGSECVDLHSDFICLCEEGKFYKENKCNEGKEFPGTLTLNAAYIPQLEDIESLPYQELYFNITKFFERTLNNSDYGETIIQKVSPSSYGTRAANYIDVSLVNLLKKDTTLTEEDVSKVIKEAIANSPMIVSYINKIQPCQIRNNCTAEAKCVDLSNEFFCLCREGYYYKENKCNEGKVFPGTLKLKTGYGPELEDKESLAYQELYLNITNFIEKAIGDSEFGQILFQKVSPSLSGKYNMRNAKSLGITILTILNKATKLTEQEVSKKIRLEAANFAEIETYDAENRCDYYGCDENNSNDCSDGFKCVCKFGMYRPYPESPRCVPDPCPQNCSSKPNMHCQWNSTQKLSKCVCLPGYMEDENRNCQKCAFGYSGENCQDQFQLILTIVGSLAGACILAMVITLIVMRVRSKRKMKENERQVLVENDFQNMGMQQTEFSKPDKDGSLFPKARVTPSSQFQNPYSFSGNSRGIPNPDY